jgi:Spy/CpxP family protein refolding chaperone
MLRELAMLGVHFYPPQLLLRRSKALGLTPDQLGKIRQEILSTQARAVDLHAKVERAKVEVARLLAAEKVDERALSAQLDEAAKAHAELHKLHVGELLHVRALLTPEQRQKLDERRHGGAGGHPGGPVGQADAPDDDDDDDDGDDEAEG